MFDQHFLSSAAADDVFGPLQGGERMMWRGRCGVAEYAFDEAASLPRWTLPETTDVLVTDHRVLYAYTAEDGHQVKSGELRWLWPQHLRVQPGAISTDRGAAATQIQMVCGGADGTYPALVFAGGDLATVGDADRLANVIRQAIARFRVDNADKLGLTPGQARMLARMLIGPEFRNHQGGEGQTVSLLGAMLVSRPVPAPALSASVASVVSVSVSSLVSVTPAPLPLDVVPVSADAITVSTDAARLTAEAALLSAEAARWAADSVTVAADLDSVSADAVTVEEFVLPVVSTAARSAEALRTAAFPAEEAYRPADEGTRLIYRPGMAADAARALMAAKAEEATQQAEPAQASRAADLAARVANLIARSTAEPDAETVAVPERGASRRVLPQRRAPRRVLPEREAPTVVGPEPEAETVIVPEVQRIVPPAGSDDAATWEVHRSAWRVEGAHRDSTWASERRPRHSEPRLADSWHSDDLRMSRGDERRGRGEPDRLGPGDGRPLGRHGDRRAIGAGERRMSRGEELRMMRAAEAQIREAQIHEAQREAQVREAQINEAQMRAAQVREAQIDDARMREARAGEARQGEGRKRESRKGEASTTNLAERAEAIRRTAARMASNAARGRIGTRRADRENGVTTRGNRNT